MPTVAINGLGRIGRAALKILLDSEGLEVAAVNDIAAPDNLAYLLRYDTVYRRPHRRSAPRTGRWWWTTGGSRCSPSATRAPCPGATSVSTWCWSAPRDASIKELGVNGPTGTAFGTSAAGRGRGALRSLSAPRRPPARGLHRKTP